MYRDCALDLETTDIGSNSRILSIGAVLFNKEDTKLGNIFYREISKESCDKYSFTTSQETMAWWSEQSYEARRVFTNPGTDLEIALDDFAAFLKVYSTDVRVWGNGSDFDNVILSNAYSVTGKPLPWSYRGNRCYRTYWNEAMVKPEETSFIGVKHNALDDAVHEAINLQILYRANNSVVQIAKHKILSLFKKG